MSESWGMPQTPQMIPKLIDYYHSLCRDIHNPGTIKLTVNKKLFYRLAHEVSPRCQFEYLSEIDRLAGDNPKMFRICIGSGGIEVWKEEDKYE